MADELPRRRSYDRDDQMQRLTRLEVIVTNLATRMDAHIADSGKLHEEMEGLISKLDARADKADLTMARLLTGVVIGIWLAQLLAPVILHAVGAPAS